MQDDPLVSLVNITDKAVDRVILDLHKVFIFEPGRPVQLPRSIALQQMDGALKICDNPEVYFKDQPMRRLIIRDGGIGDILMMEPCFRAMSAAQQIVTVASMRIDVLENNPAISGLIEMKSKHDLQGVDRQKFDCVDDMRDYSESCVNREKKHRTDCYNQIFHADIKDYEPRLYFTKDEGVQFLKKKDGYRYIGLSFDASHKFRQYKHGKELVGKLLEENEKNIVVLMGSYDFCLTKKDKRILDYQGKTSVREMFRLVRDLDVLIAVDSGVMHVGLTLHVPTVCIFSIIFPHLRGVLTSDTKDTDRYMGYYKGPYNVIFPDNKMACRGCGSLHMAECRYANSSATSNVIPKCMDIPSEAIISKINELPATTERRIFEAGVIDKVDEAFNAKEYVKAAHVCSKQFTLATICLNEQHNIPRFIDNVIKHPAIGRVIAIDGGSTDDTVKLLTDAGAEVYHHFYDKTFHEAQSMQRNISCSYIKDGTPTFIMDCDECFSKELYDYLSYLAANCPDYGLVSRRTFKYYADINDTSKQIKNYPDLQPRIYKWDKRYKFTNGAHHHTLNCPEPVKVMKDILHFECEGKDREAIEKQWSQMMDGVRMYNA
jgi:ADP-heptose:LPS heptosyltransferase